MATSQAGFGGWWGDRSVIERRAAIGAAAVVIGWLLLLAFSSFDLSAVIVGFVFLALYVPPWPRLVPPVALIAIAVTYPFYWDHLFEVPITAMLVLEVGGAGQLVAGRVFETFIGAAIGIGVSALIAPPLYLQPAGVAIGEVADRLAGFTRDFAAGLRGPWSRGAADHWLNRARALGSKAPPGSRSMRGGATMPTRAGCCR